MREIEYKEFEDKFPIEYIEFGTHMYPCTTYLIDVDIPLYDLLVQMSDKLHLEVDVQNP